MARKTYLTPALQKEIVKHVRNGNALSVAAEFCNVPAQTVSDWRRRGESGREDFSDFSEAVKKAEAAVEVEMVRRIRDAARGEKVKKVRRLYKFSESSDELFLIEEIEEITTRRSWSAALTWLKLRRPQRWREKQELEELRRPVTPEEINPILCPPPPIIKDSLP